VCVCTRKSHCVVVGRPCISNTPERAHRRLKTPAEPYPARPAVKAVTVQTKPIATATTLPPTFGRRRHCRRYPLPGSTRSQSICWSSETSPPRFSPPVKKTRPSRPPPQGPRIVEHHALLFTTTLHDIIINTDYESVLLTRGI